MGDGACPVEARLHVRDAAEVLEAAGVECHCLRALEENLCGVRDVSACHKRIVKASLLRGTRYSDRQAELQRSALYYSVDSVRTAFECASAGGIERQVETQNGPAAGSNCSALKAPVST